MATKRPMHQHFLNRCLEAFQKDMLDIEMA